MTEREAYNWESANAEAGRWETNGRLFLFGLQKGAINVKSAIGSTFLMTLGVVVVGVLFGLFLNIVWFPSQNTAARPQVPAALPGANSADSSGPVAYNPPQPADAPADIREAVLYGANILTDTQKVLASNVGNKLNCSNCHFNAGETQGGKNGGISLVGVAATYPKYRDRQKYAVDLVARAND